MIEWLGLDWFVLLAPVALLPIVLLLVFVGCPLPHAAELPEQRNIILRTDPAVFNAVSLDVVGLTVRPEGGMPVSATVRVTTTGLIIASDPPMTYTGRLERVLRLPSISDPRFLFFTLVADGLPAGSGSYMCHARIVEGSGTRGTVRGARTTFTTRPDGRVPPGRFLLSNDGTGNPFVEPLGSGLDIGLPVGGARVELAYDAAEVTVLDVTFGITVTGATTVGAQDVTLTPTTIGVTAGGVRTSPRAGRYDGLFTQEFPGRRERYRLVVTTPSPGTWSIGCRATIRTDTGAAPLTAATPARFTVASGSAPTTPQFQIRVASGIPSIITR